MSFSLPLPSANNNQIPPTRIKAPILTTSRISILITLTVVAILFVLALNQNLTSPLSSSSFHSSIMFSTNPANTQASTNSAGSPSTSSSSSSSSSSTSTQSDRIPLSSPSSSTSSSANVPSQGWIDHGSALSDQVNRDSSSLTTDLTLLLKQQHLGDLQRLATEVSDPSSSRYGQFLTPDAISNLIHPSKEQQKMVVDWVKSVFHLDTAEAEAQHVKNLGDSIQLHQVRVADVEAAFKCQMHQFEERDPNIDKDRNRRDFTIIPRPLPPLHATQPSHTEFVPRFIYRCALDSTPSIPSFLQEIVTGSIGLKDFPTRWSGGPRPMPVPVGPNPHIDPIRQTTGHTTISGSGSATQPTPVDPPQSNKPQSGAASESQPQSDSTSATSSSGHSSSIPLNFKPHQTFRTKEQLSHVVEQFEKEQRLQ